MSLAKSGKVRCAWVSMSMIGDGALVAREQRFLRGREFGALGGTIWIRVGILAAETPRTLNIRVRYQLVV